LETYQGILIIYARPHPVRCSVKRQLELHPCCAVLTSQGARCSSDPVVVWNRTWRPDQIRYTPCCLLFVGLLRPDRHSRPSTATSMRSAIALTLTAIVAQVAADQIKVYHRLLQPSRPVPSFTPRGSINFKGGDEIPSASFDQLESASKDVQRWLEGLDSQKGYYQLAIQHSEDDQDQGSWNIQSVHIVRWHPLPSRPFHSSRSSYSIFLFLVSSLIQHLRYHLAPALSLQSSLRL
jgi:hypothetical protein